MELPWRQEHAGWDVIGLDGRGEACCEVERTRIGREEEQAGCALPRRKLSSQSRKSFVVDEEATGVG